MPSPMTLIVVLVLALFLGAGVAILRRAMREGAANHENCPSCGLANPSRAKFCAHCGASLD